MPPLYRSMAWRVEARRKRQWHREREFKSVFSLTADAAEFNTVPTISIIGFAAIASS
jgi:hypothetical protein